MSFDKNVSWGKGDKVSLSKLRQMVANDEYLFENMPKVRYDAFGVPTSEGVKMLAGNVFFEAKQKDTMEKDVAFKGYFQPGCEPIIIVTPVITPDTDPHVFAVIYGRQGQRKPDNTGFKVRISHQSSEKNSHHFGGGTNLYWLAIGY